MVTEHKAYEAEMYADYKSGALDKYVKPEVLEEQRLFRQKKIDNVLAKAYDEVFYQKPVSGDYKYECPFRSLSFTDIISSRDLLICPKDQTNINTALKRVTQDMQMKKTLKNVEEKMQLSDFDTKGRKPNASGGPVDHDALVQMYLAEGLSYEEAVQAAQSAGNLPWDTLKKAEGGRADFIFGGSAGLRALLKRLKGGRKRIFPSPPQGIKKFMSQADTDYIDDLKLQQLETILKAAKIDKNMIAQIAKNKKMADPGLDFLMGKMDEIGLMPKNISKYTDIDKDIMDVEMMIKNYTQKKLKRRPHNLGGRIGYAGGGKAGLPAITQGTPQPGMQQPQMPAGPQPAGIPGGTIVAQNQMQQAPWMGSQMQQGMGGQPRPQPQGQPRMPFGLGGMTRRAFMKLMAGITGTGIAAGSGLLKLGSKAAPKAVKVTEEVIKRGPDGMPAYVTDLIEVVKAKGTKDFVEGFKRSDYSTVHSYKGVDVIEDTAGNTRIKQGKETSLYGSDEPAYHEIEMEIRKGEWIEPTKTKKGIKTTDEYVEYTAKPDMDGKLKDVDEYIDEMDHLELKEIADEVDTLVIKKASGGLAYALGE